MDERKNLANGCFKYYAPPSPLLNRVITISNASRNETIGYHTVIIFVLLCNVSFFVLDDFNTDMH